MDVPKVPVGFFVVICGIVFVYGDGLQNSSCVTYDTIVVGLGASGVAAASTLARAGKKVLGLEVQDRIGGRVKTVSFGEGVVEMGAEWIHGERPSRVYDLAIKNNITIKKQNSYTEILTSDDSPVDQEFLSRLMELCMDLLEESYNVSEPLGRYLTKKVTEYIKDNKPELLKDPNFLEEILDLINLMISNYEASSNWDELSTYSMYEDLEGCKHWSWHKNGYKTLFDIMLNTHKNGPGLPSLDIKLNTEVVSINWPEVGDGKVSVKSKDGEVFEAHNVVVTVSLGVLKARHKDLFARPLPEKKVKAVERIPMGLLDKIIFSFLEPWWPHDQRSFYLLWKKSDKNALSKEDLWTTKIPWVSCSLGSSNVIELWTSGENAKFMETLPEEVVKRKSLQLLQKFMAPNVTVPEPTGMIRTTWFTNPYTRGSYSYEDQTVVQFPQTRAALAEPLKDAAGNLRVLFAGEASDESHFATVHGATDTGFREALRLMG